MDASKKIIKKVPPLPKFSSDQNQPKDPELEKKLNSFLIELQKQSKNNQTIKKQQLLNNHNNEAEVKQPYIASQQKQHTKQVKQIKAQTPSDKKKISLASINSKLNNMLNSKKLTLNKPPEQKQKIAQPSLQSQKKQPKKRNQLQAEYDPSQPNNYDLAKQFYLQKLQKLNQSSQEEQSQQQKDIKQNKIGYNQGLRIKQMIDQAEGKTFIQQEMLPEQQELQQKEEIALRMMQKLGYKVGQGLGKQSQGIKTPLTIKKTTDSSCTIEQSSISFSQMIRPQTSAKNALIANNITITQVVVFINLVTISQLNDEVQTDLKSQCQIYGNILKYIAYMMKDSSDLSEMRIFIQFSTKQQAFNLFVKLNNKFYNQKLASIRFYPKSNFQKMDLNLKVHQHIQT